MSQMKKFMVKAGLLAIVAWGGYTWMNQSPERAENFVSKAKYAAQVTEDRAEAVLDKTSYIMSENTALASKAWEKSGVERKVDDLQDRAQPLRKSIRKTAQPVTKPVVNSARWLDQHISLMAILFMIVTGSMVVIMAASMIDNKDYS